MCHTRAGLVGGKAKRPVPPQPKLSGDRWSIPRHLQPPAALQELRGAAAVPARAGSWIPALPAPRCQTSSASSKVKGFQHFCLPGHPPGRSQGHSQPWAAVPLPTQLGWELGLCSATSSFPLALHLKPYKRDSMSACTGISVPIKTDRPGWVTPTSHSPKRVTARETRRGPRCHCLGAFEVTQSREKV